MICSFCQQDVNDPCHNLQELQQRAQSHIERCENAYRRQGGGSRPQRAPSTDTESGGSQG